VLLVDRAAFPSDTVSTHLLHAPAVAALRRWGLLEELLASGCPPIERYSIDFGPLTIAGTPPPVDGSSLAYAPRRTILDKVLVDAADRAGAEVRERFSVDEILVEDGAVVGIRGRGPDGRPVRERARVVIGADGRNSRVARAVRPEPYHEKPMLMWPYYSYWSDLPTDGFETFTRPGRGWAAAPTNDGLTMLVVGWPMAEAAAYKADVEANYLRTLDLDPPFAARVRAARREAPFAGGASPNLFRRPFGPGWALVGDAGYVKDPITAQGIVDAFRDAELCADALDRCLRGTEDFEASMATYQRTRDHQVLPMYEFTAGLAALEPPPPELQQVLAAVHGNQAAMDEFLGVSAGIVSPADFFAPEHLGPLLGSVAA
jgi:2-polyprenyl-6-methoxyphenol hydroxylase-like FAD-dependent oxidoreductase